MSQRLRPGQNVRVRPRLGVPWRGVVHSLRGSTVLVVPRERGAYSRQPLPVARRCVSPALAVGRLPEPTYGSTMGGQHTDDLLRLGASGGRVSHKRAPW